MRRNIGNHIRAARVAKSYTQEKLAELLNVSFQAVSSWECGTYLPDTDKLIELSKILGVSIDLLLNDKPYIGKSWTLQDRMFDEKNMRNQVYHTAHSLNMTNTLKALDFASEKHKFMTRKGKDKIPYIYHPLLMACQALALGLKDDEIVATCLLHDVVEDCGVQPEDLPVNKIVQDSVRILSRDKSQSFSDYIKLIKTDRNASIVKVIDRCSNISTMATGFSEEKIAEYIAETEQYILPLIEDVRHTYSEFYDSCFLLKYQILSVISTVKHVIK